MISFRKIKIIDCTLRDGGYYNDWNFSKKLIQDYIHKISKTNICYIELGFRFSEKYNIKNLLSENIYSFDVNKKSYTFRPSRLKNNDNYKDNIIDNWGFKQSVINSRSINTNEFKDYDLIFQKLSIKKLTKFTFFLKYLIFSNLPVLRLSITII